MTRACTCCDGPVCAQTALRETPKPGAWRQVSVEESAVVMTKSNETAARSQMRPR